MADTRSSNMQEIVREHYGFDAEKVVRQIAEAKAASDAQVQALNRSFKLSPCVQCNDWREKLAVNSEYNCPRCHMTFKHRVELFTSRYLDANIKRFKAMPLEVKIEDEPRLVKALKYKDVKREDYPILNSLEG